jgi:uncharacterized membrane protein YeaQ/YmgE (transglycosylase-associated protein family)
MLELIIGALLLGIIIGPLARLVLPGEQNISLGMTILLGALGALVGGIIYQALGGTETAGIDWILHLVQIVVAAVAVVIYINMRGRRAA